MSSCQKAVLKAAKVLRHWVKVSIEMDTTRRVIERVPTADEPWQA